MSAANFDDTVAELLAVAAMEDEFDVLERRAAILLQRLQHENDGLRAMVSDSLVAHHDDKAEIERLNAVVRHAQSAHCGCIGSVFL